MLSGEILFKITLDSILLRCVYLSQANKILEEIHDGSSRGHFLAKTTTLKIMRAIYFLVDNICGLSSMGPRNTNSLLVKEGAQLCPLNQL